MSNNWQAYLDHDLPKVERIPHPTKVIRRPDPKRARKHHVIVGRDAFANLKERKFPG